MILGISTGPLTCGVTLTAPVSVVTHQLVGAVIACPLAAFAAAGIDLP